MRFAAWSSIVIGVLMALQWTAFLVMGQVPEVRTAPIALSFHLVAEAATAAALIIAGLTLIRGGKAGTHIGLVANGMLIYTVIVSPGYFAQSGEWPLVAMFVTLLIAAVANAFVLSAEASRARGMA